VCVYVNRMQIDELRIADNSSTKWPAIYITVR